MRLDEACDPIFARHETFHPRWGWIYKAISAAEQPDAFVGDDSTLRLGVGKNQVRAIRFWGHASKCLTVVENPERPRLALSAPTRIGSQVFGPGGWDPYTEEPGTLWVLHWLLLAPRSKMPVWWSAFCEFGAVEFTEEQLLAFVRDQVSCTSAWTAPHQSSLAKDVSCLLRTYAGSVDVRRTPFDDQVDAPLRELGLLRCVDAPSRRFRFAAGGKGTLPPLVALFACLDFLARTGASGQTVTVSRLATEVGGPGRVLKLSETSLVQLLEVAVPLMDGAVQLARPAGVAQLAFSGDSAAAATAVLAQFYKSRGRGDGTCASVIAGPEADAPSDRSLSQVARISDVLGVGA